MGNHHIWGLAKKKKKKSKIDGFQQQNVTWEISHLEQGFGTHTFDCN